MKECPSLDLAKAAFSLPWKASGSMEVGKCTIHPQELTFSAHVQKNEKKKKTQMVQTRTV